MFKYRKEDRKNHITKVPLYDVSNEKVDGGDIWRQRTLKQFRSETSLSRTMVTLAQGHRMYLKTKNLHARLKPPEIFLFYSWHIIGISATKRSYDMMAVGNPEHHSAHHMQQCTLRTRWFKSVDFYTSFASSFVCIYIIQWSRPSRVVVEGPSKLNTTCLGRLLAQSAKGWLGRWTGYFRFYPSFFLSFFL